MATVKSAKQPSRALRVTVKRLESCVFAVTLYAIVELSAWTVPTRRSAVSDASS